MVLQRVPSGIEAQSPSVITSSMMSFEWLPLLPCFILSYSPLLVLDQEDTITQAFSLVLKQPVL